MPLTRWDLGRCCCAGATTVCVTACALPAAGVAIALMAAGTTLYSCTTGASGCCSFPTAGTYTVELTVAGAVVYYQSLTLAPGGTVTIQVPGTSFVCCGGYQIPQNLTLTDAAGSLSFVYYPNYFYPVWFGGHSVQRTSCSVTTPNNVCVVGSPSVGPVKVCYQMVCFAGQTPTFSVGRSWSWVYQQGTLTPIWYQDGSGITPGLPCITAPPTICGSPLTDTAAFSGDPASTAPPFALVGTPVGSPANSTADPVAGPLAISA